MPICSALTLAANLSGRLLSHIISFNDTISSFADVSHTLLLLPFLFAAAWCKQLQFQDAGGENVFDTKKLSWSHLMNVASSLDDLEMLVQPNLNIRPTGRPTVELQRREESAFEKAVGSGKSMQDAAEAAMNRPQKNRGGKSVPRRCAYCHETGHNSASCDFMDRSAKRAQQDSAEAQEAQAQMADDGEENEEGASQQTPARKRKRGYIKKKPLVGACGGCEGSGVIGAEGIGAHGAGIDPVGGSGGVAAGGVPKRQRPQSGRSVEEDGGVADDSDKEARADEEFQDSTFRGSGGGRGRAHGRARGRGGRSSRGAHGVDAGLGRGESSNAGPRAAAVGPSTSAEKEVEVKKELLVEGKEWVKSFIPVMQPPGAVLERTVIADDVDTADADQEVQFLKHVQTPTKQAIEVSTGGCKSHVLKKLATEFKELMGPTVRVAGDGSCWLYALLATHGVIEHAISNLQVHTAFLSIDFVFGMRY